MNQQNMQRSGHRSSNRGGSRRPRRDGGRYDDAPKPPAKKTFWQKLVAFFTGEPQPAARANGTRQSEAPRQSSRKPEVVEVTSPKLYVGNLSFDATESDLFDLFNGVGKVSNAEVVSHRETQRSKGFAFVTMNSTDEAKRAVMELHDKDFMGRKLVVSGAKTSDMRGG